MREVIKNRKINSFYSRLLKYSAATLNSRIIHWVARIGGLSNHMLRKIYYSAVRERTFSAAWLNCSIWLFHKMLDLEWERKKLWGNTQDFDTCARSVPRDSLPMYLLLAYGMQDKTFTSIEIRFMLRHVLPLSLQRVWIDYHPEYEPMVEDWVHLNSSIV